MYEEYHGKVAASLSSADYYALTSTALDSRFKALPHVEDAYWDRIYTNNLMTDIVKEQVLY